ncbi:MAG: DnaD domain protein [Anaerolineales bacterium]|jgi:DnaD/phage-associated family protein
MASGFSDSETFAQIPDSFFRHLLSEVDDLDELKVTLYALWRIGNMEGRVHFLRGQDFVDCIPDPGPALEKAVRRGSLLKALPPASDQTPHINDAGLYFLNSPRGRAAAASFSQGRWQPDATGSMPAPPERPNIFKLYEENIGPLTPLIADSLQDAEKTYPPEWVAEALGIAVKNNKRNLKYVEAILRRWKEEGHAKKQDRRDAQEDGRRYAEGDYADFIEH